MAGTNKQNSLVVTSTLGFLQKGWSWRVIVAKVLRGIIDGARAAVNGEPYVVIKAPVQFWLIKACVGIVLESFRHLKLG
jgi:hypothetical protein